MVRVEPTVGRPLDPREVVRISKDEAPLPTIREETKEDLATSEILDHLRHRAPALVQANPLNGRGEHCERWFPGQGEETSRLEDGSVEQLLCFGTAYGRPFSPALAKPAGIVEHHIEERPHRIALGGGCLEPRVPNQPA